MSRRVAPGFPRRLLVALLAAVGVLVLTATPALAHNELTGTAPSADQTVARTPARVVLTFNEPAVAMGTEIVVTGPSGEIQAGAPRLVDNTVTQDLQAGAPPGAYRVSWRVTSDDGHPVSGAFGFTARAAGAGTPAPGPATPVGSTPTGRTAERAGASGWAWLVLAVLVVVAVTISRRHRRRPPRG